VEAACASRSPCLPWPTPVPRSSRSSQVLASVCDGQPQHLSRAAALSTVCLCPANQRPPTDERGVEDARGQPSAVTSLAVLVGDLCAVDLGFEDQAFAVSTRRCRLECRAPSCLHRNRALLLRLHTGCLGALGIHYPRTGLGLSPRKSSRRRSRNAALRCSKVPSMRHFLNQ
jgi:hypothetical protein